MKLVARHLNGKSLLSGPMNYKLCMLIVSILILLILNIVHQTNGNSQEEEATTRGYLNDELNGIYLTKHKLASNRANNRLAATDVIKISQQIRFVRSNLSQISGDNNGDTLIEDQGKTIRAADEGSCTMRLITRYPKTSARNHKDDGSGDDDETIFTLTEKSTNERALVCSQISGYNYEELVRGFYNQSTDSEQQPLAINQLHFDSGQSQFVFSAINLTCHLFDCSNLLVFNLTEQEIHDHKELANYLATWPKLEVLDLTNTSLESIKFIQLPVVDHHNYIHNNNNNNHYHHNQSISSNSTVRLKITTNQTTHLTHLTHLHLDENKLSELDFDYLIERMPQLKCLTLANNTIYQIHATNETLRHHLGSQFEQINLAGNVINCDKSQLWLMKQFVYHHPNNSYHHYYHHRHRQSINITNNNNNSGLLLFPDHDKINCSAPSYLNELTWSQRVSVMETKICEDCACRPTKKTAISIDCHNKNLTSLPDILPLNTKILNLTSNSITTLVVPERAENWENVTLIYLENNLITNFQSPLSGNSKLLRNLIVLDIRRNRFQEFPNHILEQFSNLNHVHLSNNPWLCECESTFAFQEWLQREFTRVPDKEEIRCGSSGVEKNGLRSVDLQQELSSRVIYKLSKSELCPQHNLDLVPRGYDWLDLVNVLLSIAIIVILLKLAMDYRYQRRTKRLPHFFKLNL